LKFYRKIVKMMLKDEEIAKLKQKSTYEDDDWQMPPFVMRAKEVSLPKVNGRQVMEREKEERDLEIAEEGTNKSTGDSYESEQEAYRNNISKTSKEGGFKRHSQVDPTATQ